ncbi:MAG: hypothetical protein IPP22_14630 [Nitrosomonas sp.]|nr:hypothetical protein [Nitrosomonas sp.]
MPPSTIKRPNAWKLTCGSHCLPITWCISPFAFKAADIHDSWDTLRQRMRSHMRVTTTMAYQGITRHCTFAKLLALSLGSKQSIRHGFTSKSRRNTCKTIIPG